MNISFVIAIILAFIAVIFSLQNSQATIVSFLKWSFEAPLVLVLLATFVVGAATAFIGSIPGRIKRKREVSEARKGQGENNR
ncbi:MAG: LapA family protein [Deltaproteobacteria bacterium]|nr:LapA family protein [Deltaproteobacteria bacterium]